MISQAFVVASNVPVQCNEADMQAVFGPFARYGPLLDVTKCQAAYRLAFGDVRNAEDAVERTVRF